MYRYIIRRLLLSLPVLVGVSIVVFSLIRFLPGDVIVSMVAQAEGSVTEEIKESYKKKLGLDKPYHEAYATWVWGLVRGDLGTSLWTGDPVRTELARRIPISAELAILAVVFALVIAIPLGVLSATKQDSFWDYAPRLFSIGGLSMPDFWIGTLVIVFPAIWWRWSAPLGYSPFLDDPVRNLQQFWVPAAVLGVRLSASTMRMTRSAMLEVMREDYVRTARSKGLTERVVIYRHALRNALIPVITIVGTQFSRLLGGTVVIEILFALPGVGRFTLDAILKRDYPSVQAGVMFLATVMVIMNLVVDIFYSYVDPRIRHQ